MAGIRSILPHGKPAPLAQNRLEANNRLTMLAFFSVPPLVGPAAATILVGGGINGWYRIFAGNLSRPQIMPALLLAFVFALFPLSELVSWAVNSRQLIDLKTISSSLLFLFAVPVYARLSLSRVPDIWRAMYRGAAIACIGAGVLALIGMSIGMNRAEGGAGNPVPFAVVLSVLLPLGLSGWKDSGQQARLMIGVAAFMGTIAIVLSGTRSMMFATVINLVLVALFLNRSAVSFRRIAATGVLVLVTGTLIASSSDFIGRHLGNTIRDFQAIERGDYRGSAGRRLRMWHVGTELIAERPIFGYGPQSVTKLMQEKTTGPTSQETLSFTHFHNLVINALVRGGIPELLASVSALFTPLLMCAASMRRRGFGPGQLIASVLFSTYFINGAVSSAFWHDILNAFYVQTAVCSVYLCYGAKPARFNKLPNEPGHIGPRSSGTVHRGRAPALTIIVSS
jgi:O-antigen ligase